MDMTSKVRILVSRSWPSESSVGCCKEGIVEGCIEGCIDRSRTSACSSAAGDGAIEDIADAKVVSKRSEHIRDGIDGDSTSSTGVRHVGRCMEDCLISSSASRPAASTDVRAGTRGCASGGL